MNIVKRDGTLQEFDLSKIRAAVIKASESRPVADRVPDEVISDIVSRVELRIKTLANVNVSVGVEQIQDFVETEIMSHGYYEAARAYIKYRYQRQLSRDRYAHIMNDVGDKLLGKTIDNQNANVDEKSFGGRLGEATSRVSKEFALNNIISEKTKRNHEENRIYIHDLDHYALGDHNCLSVPIDDILAKGFKTRQVDIRPAGSINTALQLVAVIFQCQSLNQFGGVSATHLDWSLVPYVRKSFAKHFIDGNIYLNHYKREDFNKQELSELPIDDIEYRTNDDIYQYAMAMTEREMYQACEGLAHNLNSLQSRHGGQLPFSSINYGTCTLPEGRMFIENMLNVSIHGLGKSGRTAIFPCQIFQLGEGINKYKGDPNYDMFRLALKSTSQRLYPNYANIEWSGNRGYDKNDPRTYFSTMGALAGKERIYVKISGNDPVDISIKDLFEYLKTGILKGARPCQIFFNKGRQKNTGNRHTQAKSSIPIASGVYSVTYLPQDVTYYGSSYNVNRRLTEHRSSIRLTGGLDAGPSFDDTDLNNYKFDVVEYTEDFNEVERKYIENHANINFKGVSQRYYKILGTSKMLTDKPSFRFDPSIPQELIQTDSLDIKVLDRGNKWVKMNHIFKNDKKNSPYMMHIGYEELGKTYYLSCTEDHPLWNGQYFVRADKLCVGDTIYRGDNLALPVTSISWHWEPVDSYDVGTATGSFIGSDIIMHNCRTANGYDINGLGQLKDGRGNICPTTIILPQLAMEAIQEVKKEELDNTESNRVETFLDILARAIRDAKDSLIERFNWICSQPACGASFMYENNLMAGYIQEEGIKSALKHGTLAIGQLGLAECLQLLVGCNHTNPKGMEVAKRIEKLFKDMCAEYKEKYKLNFGVYYTPAENLCYTALKKFRDKYGVIENVSDKEFFTNSMHIPVWEDVDVFEKIDLEAQLTGYSSAGCITYVELEGSVKHNIDALEEIVVYAMDKDIPYFAINVPGDQCQECGYQDEMNDKCPKCGSPNIKRLRRVTGYLTNDFKTSFNKGKQDEVEHRVKHDSL